MKKKVIILSSLLILALAAITVGLTFKEKKKVNLTVKLVEQGSVSLACKDALWLAGTYYQIFSNANTAISGLEYITADTIDEIKPEFMRKNWELYKLTTAWVNEVKAAANKKGLGEEMTDIISNFYLDIFSAYLQGYTKEDVENIANTRFCSGK